MLITMEPTVLTIPSAMATAVLPPKLSILQLMHFLKEESTEPPEMIP